MDGKLREWIDKPAREWIDKPTRRQTHTGTTILTVLLCYQPRFCVAFFSPPKAKQPTLRLAPRLVQPASAVRSRKSRLSAPQFRSEVRMGDKHNGEAFLQHGGLRYRLVKENRHGFKVWACAGQDDRGSSCAGRILSLAGAVLTQSVSHTCRRSPSSHSMSNNEKVPLRRAQKGTGGQELTALIATGKNTTFIGNQFPVTLPFYLGNSTTVDKKYRRFYQGPVKLPRKFNNFTEILGKITNSMNGAVQLSKKSLLDRALGPSGIRPRGLSGSANERKKGKNRKSGKTVAAWPPRLTPSPEQIRAVTPDGVT
ncbi:unnamed protein product [Bemisia tabaci]|uniref:Uncharacterized protein n=1 Tax=Bemisia tabaci TaxID=7038 RepID=A0A9P0AIH2_BEMTA|nr:unnamed protein product [Bemisia tabaci]